MAIPSKAVKSTAKAALKGNWLAASSASIIFLLSIIIVSFACTLLSSVIPEFIAVIIFFILTLALICPLFLGLIKFFKNLIFDTYTSIAEIFIYLSSFSAYKKVFRFIIELLARLVFYSVICFLPPGILKLITSDFFFDLINMDTPLWAESLDTLLSFLVSMATFAVFFIMLRYYLAPFLLVADDDMAVGETIHMSTVISRRSTSELWPLVFSFFGYIVLTLFMIPIIFTLPYFLCAFTVHSRYAVTNFNLSISQPSTNRL